MNDNKTFGAMLAKQHDRGSTWRAMILTGNWRIVYVVLLASLLPFSAVNAGEAPAMVADTNKPNTSTYVLGEHAEIVVSLSQSKPRSEAALSVSILDEYGKPVAEPRTVPVVTDPLGRSTYRMTMPTDRLGYFEVRIHLADGTTLSSLGSRLGGFLTYAVVPDPANRVDYGDVYSRFGMQGGFNGSANVIHYLGVRYILQPGTGWAVLEPNFAGEYSTNREAATKKGSRLPLPDPVVNSPVLDKRTWRTYTLTALMGSALPSWALNKDTAGTGGCKTFGAINAASDQSLTNFAHEVAKGYHSDYADQKNRYYQITWEPATGWCFRGSAADLVHIYALSYAAIHEADPGAVVAGPTLFLDSDSSTQLRELWKAGLGKYVDALAIHPYVRDFPPEGQKSAFLDTLRSQLQEAKAAIGHDVPFIGTEHGYKSGVIGNLNKALGDIRATTMMLGEGAKFDFAFYVADYWEGSDPLKSDGYGFYWNLNPRRAFGTEKIAPKIVVPAYAALTYLLDGTTSDGTVNGLSGTQIAYRFRRNDNYSVLVIWDYGGQSSYSIGPGLFVCDWMGNCSGRTTSATNLEVGAAPTYVLSIGKSAVLPNPTKPAVHSN